MFQLAFVNIVTAKDSNFTVVQLNIRTIASDDH